MSLYTTDSDHWLGEGVPITTQSMLKAFRMCPREAYYKYHLRLKPKVSSQALTRGKWVHELLEAFYKGEDWEPVHEQWSAKYAKLFDEEKEKLGPLPTEIKLLMKSYFYHYGDPEVEGTDWTVHEVERLIEAVLPNGHLFRGKVDMIVENEFGLWLVDHKTHARFPDWSYRMFDEQSTLYTWAARENDIPVQGFIWNYIGTSGFPKYQVLKNGSAFFEKSFKAESTYPAFMAAVKRAKKEHPDTFLQDPDTLRKYKHRVAELKADRWKGPDAIPTSAYFRRDVLTKNDEMIERALKSVCRTSETMHSYDFTSDPDAIERDIGSCSKFFCNFKDLSMADLVMGNSDMLRRRNYREEDPLLYQTGEDEAFG